MNKVTLFGNLTSKPETINFDNGSVTNFSIATNRSVKKGDTWEKEATFHRCKAFGNLGNVINNYFDKGSKILVEGRIDYRKYTDSNGVEKQSTEIIVSEIYFIDKKKSDDYPQQVDINEDIDDGLPF